MGSTDAINGNGDRLDMALSAIRLSIEEREARRAAILSDLRDIDAELKRLRTAERALDPPAAGAKHKPQKKSTADVVHGIMTELHVATQAQVAVRLGKPKNTAKHALEQLVARGLIIPTGNVVNRSPEFALAEA